MRGLLGFVSDFLDFALLSEQYGASTTIGKRFDKAMRSKSSQQRWVCLTPNVELTRFNMFYDVSGTIPNTQTGIH